MTAWQRPEKCGSHGACIEIRAGVLGWILMRASDPRAVLTVRRDEFAAFIDACKAGEYDHLTGGRPE